jgi:hypothetical protein
MGISPVMIIKVPAARVTAGEDGTFITGWPRDPGQVQLGPFTAEPDGDQEYLVSVPAGRMEDGPAGLYVTDGTAAGVRFGPFLPATVTWPGSQLEMTFVARIGWCVVEMKGHRVYGAQVTVARLAGVDWLVCDIPDERTGRAATQIVHPDSIYALSPCDQPTARRVAAERFGQAFPLNQWELDPDRGVRGGGPF